MTIEMTTTALGTNIARVRGANIDRISDATRRSVLGTWTPKAIEDDNAPEYALAATEEEDLLDLVPVAPAKPYRGPAATERQVTFLTKLAAERGVAVDTDDMTKAEASAKIDELLALPKAPAAPAKTPEGIEDGIYLLDGEIYKVQHAVHGSGNQYAKRLVAPEAKGDAAGWEYTPGLIRKLTRDHKMTLAQAEEYGALYGVCVRCGRVLTDEDSIAAAMGKICRGKF